MELLIMNDSDGDVPPLEVDTDWERLAEAIATFKQARVDDELEDLMLATDKLLNCLDVGTDSKTMKEVNEEAVIFWMYTHQYLLPLLKVDPTSTRPKLYTPSWSELHDFARARGKLKQVRDVTLLVCEAGIQQEYKLKATSQDGKHRITTGRIIGCHTGEGTLDLDYGGHVRLAYITRSGSVYTDFCPNENNQPPVGIHEFMDI